MENIQNYRQPMVTATGIFLGFLLSFTSVWVVNAFTKYFIRDLIVCVSIMMSQALLMIVLFRMLNMNYPADKVVAYYQRTLRLFLIAVAIPFVAFILVILRVLITRNPAAPALQ
jgi:hypothetical protein